MTEPQIYLIKLTRIVTQEAQVFISSAQDDDDAEQQALAWAMTKVANSEWGTVETGEPEIKRED
jgi:hypothetical protein